MLELSYNDYKNNSLENLFLGKISYEDFLKIKRLKQKDLSRIILFSSINELSPNLQNLIYNELKKKKKDLIPLLKNKIIIATTSKNIKNSLRNNNFSNELFYQLDMYNIFTIPLRERPEDIEALVKNFIREYNNNNNKNKEIQSDAFLDIINYIWSGNIKQLKNFIFRILNLSNQNLLEREFIISELSNEFLYEEKNYLDNWKINFRNFISSNIRGYLNNNSKIDSGIYYKLLKEFEKPLLLEILNFTNHNQVLASEILGINRNTLRKKMFDYNIQVTKKSLSNDDN